MSQRREQKQTGKKNSVAFIAILLMASFFSLSVLAGVVVTKSAKSGVREGMGMRSSTRAHKGIDYAESCGTVLTTGAPVTCHTGSGWGAYALVDRGCGVQELYAHLSRCVSGQSQVTTGGAAGSAGAGNSTGCHLHYELKINGCHVNPETAYGQDLCQESVKTTLFNEAKSKIGKFATCSAGALPTQTNTENPTPQPDMKSVTAVPTGGVDPTTGVVNTGSSYLISETFDGRIIVTPDTSTGENEFPPLPPTSSDVVPTTTGGDSIEPTGCATDTWTAMVNQSVLQARREMLYNQRYILKADSTLAYSCLSQDIDNASLSTGPIFSETKRWVNNSVDIIGKTVVLNRELGDTSLDGALKNAVLIPYDSYLNDGFFHSFLGGTTDDGGAGGGIESDGSPQGHATCGQMATVWQTAKCTNVTSDGLSTFKKFDELITAESDPRVYPASMSCKNTGIFQNMIDLAKGKSVNMSPLKSYVDTIYPKGSKCADPIATGVMVHRQVGSFISTEKTYTDAVCITVGCSYQNAGSSGMGTCEVKGP